MSCESFIGFGNNVNKTDLAIYVLYLQFTYVCFYTELLGRREGQKGREGFTESACISRASRTSN